MKRAAAATEMQKQKKAKEDPTAKKLSIVSNALKVADMTPAAVEMVQNLLPLSLGVARDQRHRYQEAVVELVGSELDKIEETLRKAILETGAVAEAASAAKTSSEETLEQATAAVEKLRAVLEEKKVELADTTMGYRSARDALKAAQDEEQAGSAGLDAAALSKKTLEELSEQIGAGHETRDQVPTLIKGLRKHLEIVDSLLTAMPSALEKEPASRSAFESLVVDQVREQISKRLVDLGAAIESGEPKRGALAAAVAASHTAFDAAREQLKAGADMFTQAQNELSAAEAAAKAAQQALKAARAQARQDEQGANSAQAELDLFQEVRDSFGELREAVTTAQRPAGDEEGGGDELATTQVAGCAGA